MAPGRLVVKWEVLCVFPSGPSGPFCRKLYAPSRPLLKERGGGGYPRVTQLASCLCLPPNHLQPPLQPPLTAPNRFVSHLQPPL